MVIKLNGKYMIWKEDKGVEVFFSPKFLIRSISHFCTNAGLWNCVGIRFLKINEKYLISLHYHIGWNDACKYSGFRIRSFQILGCEVKLPFFNYDSA